MLLTKRLVARSASVGHGVDETGELDTDTWQTLSDIRFPPGSGSAGESVDTGRILFAIQRLPQGYGYDVHRMGHRRDAVDVIERSQSVVTCTPTGEECPDVDGPTGEHTWRALVTGGI